MPRQARCGIVVDLNGAARGEFDFLRTAEPRGAHVSVALADAGFELPGEKLFSLVARLA
jgi:hypothetical protein